jgi:hypothetical protein
LIVGGVSRKGGGRGRGGRKGKHLRSRREQVPKPPTPIKVDIKRAVTEILEVLLKREDVSKHLGLAELVGEADVAGVVDEEGIHEEGETVEDEPARDNVGWRLISTCNVKGEY